MKTYPKIEILASFGIEHHHRHRAAGRHNSVCAFQHPLHIEGTLSTYTHKNREFFCILLLFWTRFVIKMGLISALDLCTMKILARFYIFLLCYYIIRLYVSQSAKAV